MPYLQIEMLCHACTIEDLFFFFLLRELACRIGYRMYCLLLLLFPFIKIEKSFCPNLITAGKECVNWFTNSNYERFFKWPHICKEHIISTYTYAYFIFCFEFWFFFGISHCFKIICRQLISSFWDLTSNACLFWIVRSIPFFWQVLVIENVFFWESCRNYVQLYLLGGQKRQEKYKIMKTSHSCCWIKLNSF